MANKQLKQNEENWLKILIVLIFIINLIWLGISVSNKPPKYEYYTKIITLENTNTIESFDGIIVNYLCDEGVVADTMTMGSKTKFYASTWEGTDKVKTEYKGMIGTCMIKARRKI